MFGKTVVIASALAFMGTSAFIDSAEAALIDVQASIYTPLVPNGATNTVIATQGVTAPYSAPLNGNGYTVTFNLPDNQQGIVAGSVSRVHAVPVAGVSGGQPTYLTGDFGSATTTDISKAGNYLSTGTGTITLNFAKAQTSLALLWGSIDVGNEITFGNGDTITGTQVQSLAKGFAGNGVRGPGGSAYVIATENDPFTSVTFSSDTVSFEFAGIVASTGTISTVPLPASAPMFGAALLGLAGIGFAAKRKKAAAAA